MSTPSDDRKFTLVGLIGLVAAVVVALSIVLPVLQSLRRTSQLQTNNTQLRGIHQSFIIYTHRSYKGGGDARFPGIDTQGQIVPNGPATGFSGDGSHPAARFWIMLTAQFFTPAYLLNPADSHVVEADYPPDSYGAHDSQALTPSNYSYAVLSIVGSAAERAEWDETLTPGAVVLGDRAIGSGPTDISSVYTERGSGEWEGGVVFNDNSVKMVQRPVLPDTRYGGGTVNPRDDLFAQDHDADDAFLVHDDGMTAYSAE